MKTTLIVVVVLLAAGLIAAKLAGPSALTIHGESAIVKFEPPRIVSRFMPTCDQDACGNQLAMLCMDDNQGPDYCASAVFAAGGSCSCTCYGGEIVISACVDPDGITEGPDGFPF